MKLYFSMQKVELTDTLRAYAWRRLQFVLSRFRPRITRVKIHLKDLEGPNGVYEKQCRLVADVVPIGEVNVEVTDSDLYETIDHAADRLAKAVGRGLDRLREINYSTGSDGLEMQPGGNEMLNIKGDIKKHSFITGYRPRGRIKIMNSKNNRNAMRVRVKEKKEKTNESN
ncbi:MAG: HPF/RaiA family ribosome-associated protein [Candidatus Tectomicrobia bacterium]|uniref:HPF/RaiA family ribosome-associated protein n=1 Tax=Tectimicrobiota bacterium TaxID=2528274 RepID=A0A933LR04_UNCTE|nr:HPF/RaiA family ribosome-associated protein [Candidatus Tectomicrobia bacterium]